MALLLTGLLFFSFFPLFSQEVSQAVGQIEYLEGVVDIHRKGEIVELFPETSAMTLRLRYNTDRS